MVYNTRKAWELKKLRVAIIGAGFAGLSCAHELEKFGIKPVIYEKNDYIGEQYEHTTAILELTDRPINDIKKYLEKRFDIYIQPTNTINTLIHNSPNRQSIMKGEFGYFYSRGRMSNSSKKQLYSGLKHTKLILSKAVHYKTLSKKYDYVVVATGNSNAAEELGCWQDRFVGFEKVAIVTGNFDPNAIIMWINNDYAKNGYVYLAPLNEKKAYIVLVLPCAIEKQLDYYWQIFLDTENINYTIVEEYNLKHKAGYVYPHQVENIYLTGAAGGAVDPFLGFGQINSMKTGIAAAQSIAKGKDYEKLIKHITQKNDYSYEFRKAFNRLSNKDYDKLITFIGLPGIKRLIYDTKIDVLKLGGRYFSILNKRYEQQKNNNEEFSSKC